MPRTIHNIIDEDRVRNLDHANILTYREYARGDHSPVLTDEQKLILEGLTQYIYCDNICHEVVSSAADRLEFQRWECPDKAVAQYLSTLYIHQKLQDRSGEVFYDSLLDGDHAVGLQWDNARQRVKVYRERWWDGNEGIFIAYGPDDEAVYAVKEWLIPVDADNGSRLIRRRNIWYPDHLERWWSETGGSADTWQTFIHPEDGQWRVDWTTTKGDPLHIPYVHFPNAGRGKSNYGVSELRNVPAAQDQINDLQLGMSGAGRLTAYMIYTIAGMKQDEAESLTVGAGQLWASTGPETKFGTLSPGDMSQLINLYNHKVKSVARMTRTPMYVITGEWPSGEAIIQADKPSIGKARKQSSKYKDCWAEVGHRAVEIRNRFGKEAPLNEDVEKAPITAVMAEVERRDLLTLSGIAASIRPIVGRKETLRKLGYNPAEVDQIIAEMDADAEIEAKREADKFSRGQAGIGTSLRGQGAPSDEGDENNEDGQGQSRNGRRGRQPAGARR